MQSYQPSLKDISHDQRGPHGCKMKSLWLCAKCNLNCLKGYSSYCIHGIKRGMLQSDNNHTILYKV